MIYYTRFETPFCEIIIAGNNLGITNLHLNTGHGKRKFTIDPRWQRNDNFFAEAKQQIDEYFSGKRTQFSLKLNPTGTDFQKAVWRELQNIPYGALATYKDIATNLGNPKACRAIGMANSKNPIPLIVPCHRVIGSNKKLTGFAHGLEIKQKLIELEQVTSNN